MGELCELRTSEATCYRLADFCPDVQYVSLFSLTGEAFPRSSLMCSRSLICTGLRVAKEVVMERQPLDCFLL